MLLRLCCSLCSSVCMKHRIPPMLGASGFPFLFTRIHRFPANEKDFSLALEMTVRESGILASLSFSRGKALVQGHDSPSFLWKEVPRRGGGWLTQRNKKQWARSIFSYRHPESSQGIFVAAALLFSLLIRLHEAPYPSNAWSIRLPVFVHTHTPFPRKRKRFLACARNDGTGKRYSRSASFPRGKALARGHSSPSFLWKEVPRRSEGWLSQRNKKEWGRGILSYRLPKHSRGHFVAIRFLTSSADPSA